MVEFDLEPYDSRLLYSGTSRAGWHRTSSRLKCLQLAAYQEILKIRPDPAFPLVRGSLLHQGMAHYYGRLQLVQNNEDPNRLYAPVHAVQMLAEAQYSDSRHRERAENDAVGATASYTKWFDALVWNVLGVERELVASINYDGEEIMYTQRFDLVVEDKKTGLIYIVDHKTSGKRDERNERGYTRSGQMVGYHWFGEKLWGDKFGGVLINFIVIQTDISFYRVVAPRSDNRVKGHVETVKWAERTWRLAQATFQDPWNYPKVNSENGGCEHRWGECPFARLCDIGPGAGLLERDE